MKEAVSIENSVLFPEIFKLLEEGHTVTLGLKGFSMRPFLENNRDKAVLVKGDGLRKGEPVLAEVAPGHYVLHRLVKIDGDKLTLLGDGNLTPEHCRRDDVKAHVIGFYRKGNTVLDSIEGRKWKVYSWWRTRLRPIRRWLLAFYRRIWIPLFGTL